MPPTDSSPTKTTLRPGARSAGSSRVTLYRSDVFNDYRWTRVVFERGPSRIQSYEPFSGDDALPFQDGGGQGRCSIGSI